MLKYAGDATIFGSFLNGRFPADVYGGRAYLRTGVHTPW
jgi:hypothetical protein